MCINLLAHSSLVHLQAKLLRTCNDDLMGHSEYISKRAFNASARMKASDSKYMCIYFFCLNLGQNHHCRSAFSLVRK